MSFIVTEYHELDKKAQVGFSDLAKDQKSEKKDDEVMDNPETLVITFTEDSGLDDFDIIDFFDEDGEVNEIELSEIKGDDDILEVSEDEEFEFKLDEDELMDQGDSDAMPFKLPGAVDYVDDGEDEKEEEPEEVETDWEHDKDIKHFMTYVLKQYPGGIPTHDGKSTLGCERAVVFLNKLNKEISEALRMDDEDVLDIGTLENIRVNIVKDIIKLKQHIQKLNKKLKKADVEVPTDLAGVTAPLNKKAETDIVKEASTPRIQLVMTPFQRAITGIILNSVVSGGKPLEDVYEFLKKKYKFSDREELEIQQLLMDMGQPIFKDRGMIGETSGDSDEEGHGLDFIKNYFG